MRAPSQTKLNDRLKAGHLIWSDFTNSLEPILAQNTNSEPRRLSSGAGRASPAAPFAFFLRFPPAEFLFLAEKGLAGGSPAINGRGGAALVGEADALRALVP